MTICADPFRELGIAEFVCAKPRAGGIPVKEERIPRWIADLVNELPKNPRALSQ
jgi:hypothetical protein